MLKFISVILLIIAEDPSEEAVATHKNYKDTLGMYKNLSTKIFDKKYQEEIQYIDKKTNKKSNFMTLSPLQRATFVSVVIQQINQESKKMQKAWENELDKKFTSKNTDAVKKDDVIGYSKELLQIRKELASNYEKYIDKMFDEFKEEIKDDERKVMKKRIRDFHDENKLLDRRKD